MKSVPRKFCRSPSRRHPKISSRVEVGNISFISSLGDWTMRKSKINKSQRGFTLVEVIVVAIIVAALAAVAIPLYNGYVTSSRNNAAANAAGSVASFMGACINQGGSGAGIAENVATVIPAGGTTINCIGTAVVPAPTISVPTGITLTVTDLDGPGQAIGLAPGGANQTYSY